MAAEPSMLAKCLAEFLGTFLLVFTVGCNVLTGQSIWGGVSIASVLMVAIYALGGVSGVINGVFFWKALAYSAFEILGGAAAAYVFKITHDVDNVMMKPTNY
ncbi:unnamed protein product [Polarella glacialis]|uniref:Aquaporin n=1 Tax=Polarella glacialis TaxID=89957 RepID=A0A813HLM9_POLGL|nr:unnamed protein product [Polarella glacialis]